MNFLKSFEDLRNIVVTLKDKLNRKEIIDECCQYIDNNTILVRNGLYEKNVIYGIKDNSVIKFESNLDNIIYIFNYNASNVTIDGTNIKLVKNSVNVLTNTFVKEQWFTTVVSYDKSLLHDCIVYFNGSLLINDIYNRGSINIIQDLSGNEYNVKSTKTLNNRGNLGVALAKGYYNYCAIAFDVTNTEVDDSVVTLDNLDTTKDFTIIMSGNSSPINNTEKVFFELGDKSVVNSGIMAKISSDGTTITISANGGSTTVDFAKKTEGIGNTIFLEYDSTLKKLDVYNDLTLIGSIDNVTFTGEKDLILGNNFSKQDRAYYLCRYFTIWNRKLTTEEYELIKKEIGNLY